MARSNRRKSANRTRVGAPARAADTKSEPSSASPAVLAVTETAPVDADQITESAPVPASVSVPATDDAMYLSRRMDELVELFRHMDGRIATITDRQEPVRDISSVSEHDSSLELAELHQTCQRLSAELASLRTIHEELQHQNDELVHQNHELAHRLASDGVRQAVSAHVSEDESLTWEERKAKMFEQMESDTFDANEFVKTLSDDADSAKAKQLAGENFSPTEFVRQLDDRLTRAERNVQERDDEIAELRVLLQQRCDLTDAAARQTTGSSDVVMGAAAIAGLVDADELVQQERARLQELKSQWEDKFRQAEIAASLERAKLSRERQEVARRTAELEDRLEDVRRQQRTESNPPVKGRRWLAELGLVQE